MGHFMMAVETDNDAFADGNLSDELARIVGEVHTYLHQFRIPEDEKFEIHLRDINGNTVGKWVHIPSEEET